MGSPYFVHQQVNRVHVVRSATGFERIWKVVANSMNISHLITEDLIDSPEGVVYGNLREAYSSAIFSKSRVVVFLESRYDWRGWEKFQRVIIFDFSGKKKDQSTEVDYSTFRGDVLSPEMVEVLVPKSWISESQIPVRTPDLLDEEVKRMNKMIAARLKARLDAMPD